MLPSACLFLLFLCNDRDVLGPWVNRPWFNLLASLILGVLLMLSVILVVSTIFRPVNVRELFLGLDRGVLVGLAVAIVVNVRAQRAMPPDPRMIGGPRDVAHAVTRACLISLSNHAGALVVLCTVRGYAIVAMVSLLVKTS